MMDSPATALTILMFMLGGAVAIGSVIVRNAENDLLASERLVSAFLLGAGILGLLVFLVGLLRLDRPTLLLILTAAYAPLSSGRVRQWLRSNLTTAVAGFTTPMLFHVAVLGMLVVAAVPHPVGDIGNDAVAYHLQGPQIWLRVGRIVPILDNARTAFPVLIESLFAAGMGLSSDRFPAMLGVVFAGVFLVQIYAFSRSLGAAKGTALLVSFVAACAPGITSRAATGYVDIAYAAFAIAAIRLSLMSELTTQTAALAGIFLGFTLGIKYTAIPLLAITIGTLVFAHAPCLPSRAFARRVGLLLSIACAVAAPFYLKNAILLGTPIYPPPVLLAHVFPARYFPVAASAAVEHAMAAAYHGYGRGLLDFLLLPWRYTILPVRFEGSGEIGALPLALGVIGAVTTLRHRAPSATLLWMALVTLVWFLTAQQTRFFIHVIGLSFAYAAIGAKWLEREWPRAGRAVVTLLVLSSAGYGLRFLYGVYGQRLVAAISAGGEETLRERGVPYLRAWEYLNNEPAVSRVLILDWIVPTYYLAKDYVKIRGPLGELPVPGIEDSRQALAHLPDLGVTHVLDVLPPVWSQESGFAVETNSHLRLVFASDSARVYEFVRDVGPR